MSAEIGQDKAWKMLSDAGKKLGAGYQAVVSRVLSDIPHRDPRLLFEKPPRDLAAIQTGYVLGLLAGGDEDVLELVENILKGWHDYDSEWSDDDDVRRRTKTRFAEEYD